MKTEKSGFTLFWSDEDSSFIATCAKHPGLSAFGSTEEQAIHEAKVARWLIEAETAAPRMHPCVHGAAEAILMRYRGMTKDELLIHARQHHGSDLARLMNGLVAPSPEDDAYHEWFDAEVQKAIEEADKGEFASAENVDKTFKKFGAGIVKKGMK